MPLDMDIQRRFDSEVCWSGPGIFVVTSNEDCVSDFQVEVWTSLGKSFATFCNLSPGAVLGTSKAGGLTQSTFQYKLRCSKFLYTVDVEFLEGLKCDFVRTQRGMGRQMSLGCLRRTGNFQVEPQEAIVTMGT